MRHLRGKSVRAYARHKNMTHAFSQTTFFVVSKSRLIASLTRHLLVTETKLRVALLQSESWHETISMSYEFSYEKGFEIPSKMFEIYLVGPNTGS